MANVYARAVWRSATASWTHIIKIRLARLKIPLRFQIEAAASSSSMVYSMLSYSTSSILHACARTHTTIMEIAAISRTPGPQRVGHHDDIMPTTGWKGQVVYTHERLERSSSPSSLKSLLGPDQALLFRHSSGLLRSRAKPSKRTRMPRAKSDCDRPSTPLPLWFLRAEWFRNPTSNIAAPVNCT